MDPSTGLAFHHADDLPDVSFEELFGSFAGHPDVARALEKYFKQPSSVASQ